MGAVLSALGLDSAAGALGRLLLWVGGNLVAKILFGLGISAVAYKGIDVAISSLMSMVDSMTGGLDPAYSGAFNYLGFHTGLAWIMSAYTARFGTQTAYRLALRRAASS